MDDAHTLEASRGWLAFAAVAHSNELCYTNVPGGNQECSVGGVTKRSADARAGHMAESHDLTSAFI